jgi:hypothetical protein
MESHPFGRESLGATPAHQGYAKFEKRPAARGSGGWVRGAGRNRASRRRHGSSGLCEVRKAFCGTRVGWVRGAGRNRASGRRHGSSGLCEVRKASCGTRVRGGGEVQVGAGRPQAHQGSKTVVRHRGHPRRLRAPTWCAARPIPSRSTLAATRVKQRGWRGDRWPRGRRAFFALSGRISSGARSSPGRQQSAPCG